MRRRLLLLTGLTCAVAIAVLLRTVASDVESVVAVEQSHLEGSVASEFVLGDCAIDQGIAPSLAADEAAQVFPMTPADEMAIAVSLQADERSVALSPEVDFGPPKSPLDLFRDTIRPPPGSQIS